MPPARVEPLNPLARCSRIWVKLGLVLSRLLEYRVSERALLFSYFALLGLPFYTGSSLYFSAYFLAFNQLKEVLFLWERRYLFFSLLGPHPGYFAVLR